MTKGERLRKAIDYLKSHGRAKTLDDIAEKVQRSKVNISSAVNDNPRYLTDKFLTHFNMCYDNIFNLDWLIRGEGDMLQPSATAGDGSVQVFGDAKNVNAGATVEKLVDLLRKKDEQIDRLLSLLERLNE